LKIFRHQWCGAFKASERGAEKIHPTQKPVALYKWLLKNYAKPGDKIFDSHVGSGSIRIACHDMGFDFEGCEIDKDYWEAQEARYKAHASQLDMFTPETLFTPQQENLL
jgi:site-specific DNA-methyltransferase (adenine-specific)